MKFSAPRDYAALLRLEAADEPGDRGPSKKRTSRSHGRWWATYRCPARSALWVEGGGADDASRLSGYLLIPDDLLHRVELRVSANSRRMQCSKGSNDFSAPPLLCGKDWQPPFP